MTEGPRLSPLGPQVFERFVPSLFPAPSFLSGNASQRYVA